MLDDILKAEADKRFAARSLADSIAAEKNDIVSRLHEAVRPHIDALASLSLIGDYNVPVSLPDQQRNRRHDEPWVASLLSRDGLYINLGSGISPRQIVVYVSPRKAGGAEATVTLQLVRHYPHKSDPPTAFPGHTPPETIVEALFKELAPHIHMPA